MIELLEGLKTATLNSKKLREIAFELVDGELGVRTPNDRVVVEKICDRKKIVRTSGQSIESLATAICKTFSVQIDKEKDFEISSRNAIQLSECFWRKIVSYLNGQPWVFICNYAENAAAAVHNDVFGITYGFHENVTTWRGLVASGPGTFIVFYNTSNAPHSKMTYSSFARIESIEESEELDEKGLRHWKAKLSDFHMLSSVPEARVEIAGRNNQHGIQAVTFDAFRRIIELGEGEAHLRVAEESNLDLLDVPEASFDLTNVLSHGPLLETVVPDEEVLSSSGLDESMSVREFSIDKAQSVSRKRSRKLDKQTETQAVEIALAYLSVQGWELLHDNQLDGVGYDFEFVKDGQSLLIEVKGIRGTQLEFNMTAREFFVCSTQKNFRLIAITNTLNEKEYEVHVLYPSDVFRMKRRVTQYRLSGLGSIG
jgi:hypothetical protein